MRNTEESEKDVSKIIIDSARNLFARYGFRKTTMEEIARDAHMGKSSIYHYFKSKKDVFRSVVEKETDILKGLITDAINKQNDPRDKLRTYAFTRIQALNRVANFYQAFKDEYLEQYGFIQTFRKDADKYELETIKDILKKGVEQGIFVVKDLELTAYAIVIAMKGLEYPWAIERSIEDVEKNLDVLFGVLFDGIVKR